MYATNPFTVSLLTYTTGDWYHQGSINSDHYRPNDDQLRVGTLNVCGLLNRLHFPECVELVNTFDIFCCTEYKIALHDDVTVDGFTCIGQPIRQPYIRKSGGGDWLKTVTQALLNLCS